MLITHSTAIIGFSQQAKAYEIAQLRPSYPPEVLEQIKTLIPNPDARITDLAAGTGKMTRLLLEHGYVNVTAVEPVDAMRDILVSLLPRVHAIKGSSWDIPVASQSQDAIVVAQAFHWFADIESLQEIHRVLKPNGYLVIVWNKEDQSRGLWVKQLHDLCMQYAIHHCCAWKQVFETAKAKRLFKVPLGYRQFSHDSLHTKHEILALTQTRSYIATLPESDSKLLECKVKAIMTDSENGFSVNDEGVVRYPYLTNFFWAQKK